MKLSTWARQAGVHPRTAYRWFHAGLLPVPARQLATGTILVDPAVSAPGEVALFARVSSTDQRGDLNRQVRGWPTTQPRRGWGRRGWSARSARRSTPTGRTLRRQLADPDVGTVVAEHRDRLAHFGVEHIEAAAAQGRSIVGLEWGEVGDDVVRDMVEVLNSMCARLYGRRSARRRAQRAVGAAGEASM